jgi:hypothetical protein
MTPEAVAEFARAWVAHWNARDLDSILAHFSDDVRFTSPTAAATVGTATITGKAALRAYWQARLGQVRSLHFTLDRALWDERAGELVIIYENTADGRRRRACEVMRFTAAGLVAEAEALYGAEFRAEA